MLKSKEFMNKNVLLINPYITDFKCYDEWMKPLGLYYLSSLLKRNDVTVNYINCLNRFYPSLDNIKSKKYNTGDFPFEILDKPKIYSMIPRNYKRYGIPISAFKEELNKYNNLSAIIITSYMTYWYLGLFETIRIVKEIFPDVPVILGGIYATLCYDHAEKNSMADYILKGTLSSENYQIICDILHIKSDYNNWFELIPDYGIETDLFYRPIITSFGCPYKCAYCASQVLYPKYSSINQQIIKDIIHASYYDKGIVDYIFYDDALLYQFDNNLKHILDFVIDSKMTCRFHTPNGIHAKYINQEVACSLYQSGFKTVRFGYETYNPLLQKEIGDKTSNNELINAVNCLLKAGFSNEQIGVYLMAGPFQKFDDVKSGIDFIFSLGIIPKLVMYSPIPKTNLYVSYYKNYKTMLDDPLSHNDYYFTLISDNHFYQKVEELKRYINSRKQVLIKGQCNNN